jgi:hypothetical protein
VISLANTEPASPPAPSEQRSRHPRSALAAVATSVTTALFLIAYLVITQKQK